MFGLSKRRNEIVISRDYGKGMLGSGKGDISRACLRHFEMSVICVSGHKEHGHGILVNEHRTMSKHYI